MKFIVSYDGTHRPSVRATNVHSYEVIACGIITKRLPESFEIAMTVKSREFYTLRAYITRSIEVSVIANTFKNGFPPEYTHSVKWRMHKIQYHLFLSKLSVISKLLELVNSPFKVRYVLNGDIDDGYVCVQKYINFIELIKFLFYCQFQEIVQEEY